MTTSEVKPSLLVIYTTASPLFLARPTTKQQQGSFGDFTYFLGVSIAPPSLLLLTFGTALRLCLEKVPS